MTDFTGGPWQPQHEFDADGASTIIGAIDGPDEGRFHYRTVCEVNTDHDEWSANARLISAAPDLYEALAALVNAFDRDRDGSVSPKSPMGRARAALARVRGETHGL